MLERLYQFLGIALLTGYGAASLAGWEFSNPNQAPNLPPIGATLAPASRSWTGGRSASYYAYSSSSTRSGWGSFSFGGK